MFRPSRGEWFAVVAVAMLAFGLIVAWVCFGPRISITERQELVGPDDPAIALLARDAPLAEIKTAVQESGKHVDQISWRGESLLYHAVLEKRIDVARWVIEEGANRNGLHRARVPLARAIRQQDVAMVRLLVRSGADPDFDMGYDITPREIAKSVGNAEILSALPARATHSPGRATPNGATRPTTRPRNGGDAPATDGRPGDAGQMPKKDRDEGEQ